MDDSDSDCELVIDETIILSSDEEKLESRKSIFDGNIFRPVNVSVSNEDRIESKKNIFNGNIFHPISISAADMKEELFHEDTNTCNICNESFRYNVGLLCHLEMEHVELKITNKPNKIKKKKMKVKKRGKLLKSRSDDQKEKYDSEVLKPIPTEQFIPIAKLRNREVKITDSIVQRESCDICKKQYFDHWKFIKHVEFCSRTGIKFRCIYCKRQFGWESKYKKHLFKTHKLSAAVICKLCFDVFSDMTELACHSRVCRKNTSE